MALPGKPLNWIPKGVCDALDGTMAFTGAMSNLQNLIPDPTTRGLWQPRPAAVPRPGFAVANATFVSCLFNVGTRVYGMAGTPGGTDSPFCWDMVTQAFVPITGMTAHNTPFSPQTGGNWTPPHMDLIGSKIIVTHPGFTGGNGFFGVIETLHPLALTWTSTNTSPNALIFPPTWVTNFNGRAYFLVNPPGQQPAAYFSDSLAATTITNANQILTFGDNQQLTCSAGLALNNQLGGIIQSLMVFKGVDNIHQVTGDYAFQNLAVNSLNVATGTFAPNSLQSTEKGLIFMAPDGIRLIDFSANVSDPVGKDGQGITVPFINAVVPSRACAAFNTGIYRIQIQNINTQQEWWFDFVRNLWSGPHTTRVSLIIPYQNTFICTLQSGGAQVFQSDPVQTTTSTFEENAGLLQWIYQTVNLPDTDDLCENCIIEATLAMQLPPSLGVSGGGFSPGFSPGFRHMVTDPGTVKVAFLDQNSTILDLVTIVSGAAATLWGKFLWGQATWGGGVANLYPQQLMWHWPIVFRRGSVQATGYSASGAKIGQLRMRIEELGYIQPYPPTPMIPLFTMDESQIGGPDVLG